MRLKAQLQYYSTRHIAINALTARHELGIYLLKRSQTAAYNTPISISTSNK